MPMYTENSIEHYFLHLHFSFFLSFVAKGFNSSLSVLNNRLINVFIIWKGNKYLYNNIDLFICIFSKQFICSLLRVKTDVKLRH